MKNEEGERVQREGSIHVVRGSRKLEGAGVNDMLIKEGGPMKHGRGVKKSWGCQKKTRLAIKKQGSPRHPPDCGSLEMRGLEMRDTHRFWIGVVAKCEISSLLDWCGR